MKNPKRKKAVDAHLTNLVRTLQQLGIYSEIDATLHQQAALTLALIDEAEAIARDHMQVFPTGATQIAPEINNLRGLMKDWERFVDHFGLSPAARKKLGIELKTNEKPKSSLMAIRAKKAMGE